MPDTVETFDIIRPTDHRLISRGIDCVLSGAEILPHSNSGDLAARRRSFDEHCLKHGVDTSRQVLAMQAQLIVGACLWVGTAGRTAMFYAPGNIAPDQQLRQAQVRCVAEACRDAAAARMVVGQAILTPETLAVAALYRAADFFELATLLYMRRGLPWRKPSFELPPDFQLVSYTPDRRADFGCAIEASYHQTLDCPRLTGMRSMEDVLAGHQAVAFDPSLWLLLLRDAQPVGVLLMAQREENAPLELVYLGLAPQCRGMGLGGQLIQLVLQTAMRVRAAGITLAVDRANTPAVHLYNRFRFEQIAQRQVLIRPLENPPHHD